MVPEVTVNLYRQSLHLHLCFPVSDTLKLPHLMQATPLGHRSSSKESAQASLQLKRSMTEIRFMSQASKKKVKKWLELPDHDLMEKIFGKKAMREIDKIVEKRSETTGKEILNDSMKES